MSVNKKNIVKETILKKVVQSISIFLVEFKIWPASVKISTFLSSINKDTK